MAMNWTNPSVIELAGDSDPIEVIQSAARSKMLDAVEQGWQGPPFDPFELAEILKIPVVPSQEVQEAMLTPDGRRYRIDFNPSHSRRRIRFSIAHELAHTLFPDCRDQVRQRLRRTEMSTDEWQLEMLCNIAASEFLMPAGNLLIESLGRLTIDDIIRFSDDFDVSIESVLLRVVRLERRNCVVFVASESGGRYRVNYGVETHDAGFRIDSGLILPEKTKVSNCEALGYTAKGEETWVHGQSVHMECVAIPGYPGQIRPRVAGIAYRKGERGIETPRITFLTGDATKPHGEGHRVIAHVVNDGATRWGGRGFANAVRRKWPQIQDDFRDWAESCQQNHRLGETHACRADDEISVFSMIAQHGYGKSRLPRIRYHHLAHSLSELCDFAKREDATVHMPRIGCGEAGGNWTIVQDLILENLSDHGISVTVYDLKPQKTAKTQSNQLSLFASY